MCGGEILKTDTSAANLRDYLWRLKGIGNKDTAYVLAESAQQLYRDSGYSDLITFEEDIARIASVVLVISESAGSLAELGAFCSNSVISPVLRVLISESNFAQESFIRWGPVERILTANRERVGVFPWAADGKPGVLEASADPFFQDIEKFIDDHIGAASSTMQYPVDTEIAQFYDIMWIIYLADAITPLKLLELLQRIHSDVTLYSLRRKVYTLRVARWLKIAPYGSQDFYYLPEQNDPFRYGFIDGSKDKEPIRRVLSVRNELFSETPKGAIARVRSLRETQA